MSTNQRVDWKAASKTALIVELPAVKSLWDNDAHKLLDALEKRLEGVFISYACASGRGPRLQDAVAAARFMGCNSAVVVSADDEGTSLEATRSFPTILWRVSAMTVDEIASSYRAACCPEWVGACA